MAEDRHRPGTGAARRRRLRHTDRQARAARGVAHRRGRRSAAVLRPAGGNDERCPGQALSAGARDSEDPPVPQLDLRQPAPPALRAAGAIRGGEPGGRGGPRDRRGPDRASVQRRGSFEGTARVSDDTRDGVVVAPMGWWSGDYAGGRSGQATTSQRLTELGAAPTFNDNRVEVEAVG